MSDSVARALEQLCISKIDPLPEEITLWAEHRYRLEAQLRQLALHSLAVPQLCNERLTLDPLTRQTQIRPLEKLEIWLPLLGTGTQAMPSPLDSQTYWLKIDSVAAPLSIYPDAHGYVSSTEVLTSLRNCLTSLPNYQHIELDALGQAIFLKWVGGDERFKIIPAIPVDNPTRKRIYYLIPNGTGNWIRKRAWLEVERFEEIDKRYQGNFRPTVRLLKYWNRQLRGLPDEDVEILALKVFQEIVPCSSLAIAIAQFFDRCPAMLVHPSFDLSEEGVELKKRWGMTTLKRALAAMETAATHAQRARRCEEQGESENAIAAWRQIFREI